MVNSSNPRFSPFSCPAAEEHPFLNLNLSQEDFQQLGHAGYRFIPLILKIHADCLTPTGAFMAIADNSYAFLLESVEKGINVGRYSFIGFDPLLLLSTREDGGIEIREGERVDLRAEGEPLTVLAEQIQNLKVAPLRETVFFGGAVGYVGYDYVRRLEKIPVQNPDLLSLPDVWWMVPRKIIRFDHVTKEIALILLSSTSQGYTTALEKLYAFRRELVIAGGFSLPKKHQLPSPEKITSSLSREEFLQAVSKARDYILDGELQQVVLSRRLSFPFYGDSFSFYRALRSVNPSPYLFYLHCGAYQVVGSSPEMLVRLDGEQAELRPIAGTRPRFLPGRSEESLCEELLKDEKERAEHLMLVELGRNDLSRVCRLGTVQVDELMVVERYSHVLHLVSEVTGILRPEKDAFSLLKAVFPAGTLSGTPKLRAMEIIEELEPCCRGIYGGAVGYIGFDGRMDTCIAIRSAVKTGDCLHLQAGAGIVADSDPEREYEETTLKLQALFTCLLLLERGEDGWL